MRMLEIAGFPGYYIDRLGNVWSARAKGRRQPGEAFKPSSKLRRLTTQQHAFGYRVAVLRKPESLTPHRLYVHRLVLEAFCGPCPRGLECRHKNGRAGDNRLINLCWGTSSENKSDMKRHGRCTWSKLSLKSRRRIRALAAGGMPQRRIAEKFGVAKATVNSLLKGETWREDNDRGRSSR